MGRHLETITSAVKDVFSLKPKKKAIMAEL